MRNRRPDIDRIVEMVKPGSSALDLGCGNGRLLAALAAARRVRGQGVEIDAGLIAECVSAGVNVVYGDLDRGLADYPDQSFDFVILNDSIPDVREPEPVIREALRVGRQVIIGFTNSGHYRTRFRVAALGRAPGPPAQPGGWTGRSRHLLSVRDFSEFCQASGISIRERVFLSRGRPVRFLPNLRAGYALFRISS